MWGRPYAHRSSSRFQTSLEKAFREHLKQTEGHVERIERIFSEMERSPGGKRCVAIERLVEEGNEHLEEDINPEVLDAGLIAAAQKAESILPAGLREKQPDPFILNL